MVLRLFGVMALVTMTLTDARAASRAVGLRGNPGQFFDADSYPPEAIRLHQQGRVVVNLWIDTTGKVASCALRESSGSQVLDAKTCEIALERVTFEPALDKKGRPIAASYTLPVRWVLPGGPVDVAKTPFPTTWAVDMTVSVDAGGTVEVCNATTTPASISGMRPCDQFPVGSQTEFSWTRDGRPVGGTIKRQMRQDITIDQ